MMTRFKMSMISLVGCAAVALFCISIAQAKKPDNPPGGGGGGKDAVPGGLVYFYHDRSVWQMDSDGSNHVEFPNAPTDNSADPSQTTHDGERWFTYRDWGPVTSQYPNGRDYIEGWVGSESGTMVSLVAEADLEILSPLVWTPDDHSVSFIGERWVLDESGQPTEVSEAGLYVVDVEYDAAGSVSGSVPGSLTFVADLSTELNVDASGFTSSGEVAGHSWSPDQSSFAFGARFWEAEPFVQTIWVVNLSNVTDPHAVPTESLLLLDSDNGMGWPQWSPDGTRISYVSRDGNYVYDLTTDNTKLLRRTPSTSWGRSHWSPDGSHFVISHWDNFTGYDGIYRMTAELRSKTVLIDDSLCPDDNVIFNCQLITLGWRE